MLDIFTPEQKAVMLAQIMREESEGRSLRDCCRAQGITVQTFVDWKARAQKHNQFDTLHMRGVHPERQPARFRHEKPKTALQLALEDAQRRTLPDDNPEDVAAVEQGEPEPPTEPPAAPLPQTEPSVSTPPAEAASGPESAAPAPVPAPAEPDTKPVIPTTDSEVLTVPVSPKTKPLGNPRGVAAVMYQRMPWLNALDAKTEKALGPKPLNKEPGYTAWIKHRKSLMTAEQVAEIDGFFKANGSGKARDTGAKPVRKQPKEIAAAAGHIEVEPLRANNKRPVSKEVQQLAAQHAEVTGQLAELAPTHVERRESSRETTRESAEIERLKKALMALTLENLQLRGLL